MTLEKNSFVTLTDHNIYYVLETAIVNHQKYVYLMEKDKPRNLQFYLEESIDGELKLTKVEDKKELEKIGLQFIEIMKENLKNRN